MVLGILHLNKTLLSGNRFNFFKCIIACLKVTFYFTEKPVDIRVTIITLTFVSALFSLLLVYGAHATRLQFVLAWLVAQLFERAFVFVFIAVGLVRYHLGAIPVIVILVSISIKTFIPFKF